MKYPKEIYEAQKSFLNDLNNANQYHNEKSVKRLVETAISNSFTRKQAVDFLAGMKQELKWKVQEYKYVEEKNTIYEAINQLLEGGLSHPISSQEELSSKERSANPYYLSVEQRQELIARLSGQLRNADPSVLEVIEILEGVKSTFLERSFHITSEKKAD